MSCVRLSSCVRDILPGKSGVPERRPLLSGVATVDRIDVLVEGWFTSGHAGLVDSDGDVLVAGGGIGVVGV